MKMKRFILVLAALASASWSQAELASSAEAVKPLAVGRQVPALSLVTPEGASFDLAAALTAQPTVVIFYRGGWCPYCNKHLAALAEIEPKLIALGYQIVAISPDLPKNLRPTLEKNKVGYRLLSDRDMKAAEAFGVAFRVADATAAQYAQWKITLPPLPGDPAGRWLPVPAVFVIDRNGVVKFSHHDADHKVRLAPAEILRAAEKVR